MSEFMRPIPFKDLMNWKNIRMKVLFLELKKKNSTKMNQEKC